MTRTVVVVDYGMGNLRSVSQAVMHAAEGQGFEVAISADPAVIRAADRVVLPGQGAMRDCMAELAASGAKEAVLEAAATKPAAAKVGGRGQGKKAKKWAFVESMWTTFSTGTFARVARAIKHC